MRRPLNARAWLLLAAFAVGAGCFARVLEPHYPIRDWLFWRYLAAWGWTFVFCLSCLSVGALITGLLSRFGERRTAPLTVSFATGVFAFALVFFIAGVCRALRPATFYVLPGGLFLTGFPYLTRELRSAYYAFRRDTLGRPWRRWEIAVVALGVVAFAVIWVPTLVPDNASYDSRWYHLPLAERYAAEGAIARFPEGALEGGIPHLASLLYAWAMLAPGELFDRVILAAQLEAAALIFTLSGIPGLVSALIGPARTRSAWVAAFLFPSLFTYDTNLVLGADHIAALWTIPTYLLLLRCLPELRPAPVFLFTIQLCGLALSKYTALPAVVFPVLAVLARAAYLLYRRLRTGHGPHNWLWGPATALVAGVVLTTPHWLKNWLWYGDPLFPMLYRHLRAHPWTPESTGLYELYLQMYSGGPPKHGLAAALDKLHSLYDYSYTLYNWDGFHGKFPVFGSAFTFSLLALPFLPRTRHIWLLFAAIQTGIVVWAFNFPGERYLQTLLPWMAAALAAIVALAWREGWPARVGVLSLLALQVVWGAEFIFWPTHFSRRSGLGIAIDFFQQTWRSPDRGAARTKPFEEWAQLGRSVPKGSRLLLHHEHLRFGAQVTIIADAFRTQYGISYGYLGSSPSLYRLLRSFGITHVVWVPTQVYGEDSIAGELVFHTFVSRHLVNVRDIGPHRIGDLPPSEPPDDGHTVFSFTCHDSYAKGLYDLADMRVSPLGLPGLPKTPPPPRVPLTETNAAELLGQASHAVVDASCPGAPAIEGFDRIARWGNSDLFVRH